MRSSARWIGLLLALGGCPEPPPEMPPDVEESQGGERGGQGSSAAAVFPQGALHGWAVRDARAAQAAVDRPLEPLAWMARFDVRAGGEEDAPRWVRLGVVLHGGGLRLFELGARGVVDPAHGLPVAEHPAAAALSEVWASLREGGLPALSAADCPALGGEAACAPLRSLAGDASEAPAGAPERIADGPRALLARDRDGGLLLVDLEGPTRITRVPPASE